ncbi:MAG: hypothetical protein GY756_04585, partial [bacterium]|nr:hypothetical protein [bacterium]
KKIKKISEYGVIEGEESLICEESYNEVGKITSKIFHNDGIVGKEISEYNEKGELTKLTDYDSDTQINTITIYERNEEGKLLKEEITYVHAGDSKSFKVYTFNNNALQIETTDDEGDLEGKEIYKYNEDNLLIEKIKYNEYDEIEEQILNEYDENSLLIKTQYPQVSTQIYSEHHFIYNGDKKIIEEKTINKKGNITTRTERTFDEKDRVVNITFNNYPANRLIENKFLFDDVNNTEEIEYMVDGAMPKKQITKKNEEGYQYEVIEQDNPMDEETFSEEIRRYKYEYY